MAQGPDISILEDGERPVARVLNPGGRAPLCLVCEHASSAIPAALADLGLRAGDRLSHAVWDPGAETLACELSARLDAPLVVAGVSRLVHDCNRAPDRVDAAPARVETIEIPGNRDLTAEDRAQRAREVYEPFHRTVGETLDRFVLPPAFVTVHSFTPVWHGARRETEIGLLHDRDPSLAEAMLSAADERFVTHLNEPYSAKDGVTHTLIKHAGTRGLRNVMVEVRNDILATTASLAKVADALEHMLRSSLHLGKSAA